MKPPPWEVYKTNGGKLGNLYQGPSRSHSQDHLVLLDAEGDLVLTQLSRVSYDLNSNWIPAQTFRKYHNLVSQLKSFMGSVPPDKGLERWHLLRQFFFEEKGFTALSAKVKLDRCLLPYIFLSRSGPSISLALLYLCLCKEIGLDVKVVRGPQGILLKLVEQGHSHLFDFEQKAKALARNELVELINHGTDFTQSLDAQELLEDYFLVLKKQCLRERSLLQLYKVQTYLIHHQPFVLSHLVDRARAAYAIGDLVRAAEDIGQYLSFRSDRQHSKLQKILRRLRGHGKDLPPFQE